MPRLPQVAAGCFALMLAGLFVLNTHPAVFQLGLAGFTLAGGVGNPISKPANWQMTPVAVGFGALFLLHLVAGVVVAPGNWPSYWRNLQLHLPLIFLPLAFWAMPPWPAAWVRRLWLLFVGLVVLSSLGSTGYYLLHQDAINLAYTRSQIMPTRPDYVRFSLMVSLATAYCAVSAWQLPAGSPGRLGLLVAGGWLLFFQYLLAVRSGLLATTVLGLLAVAWLIWKPKAYRPAAGLLAVLLLLPLLSYWLVPTFRYRFHNTTYDVSRTADVRSANNYSMVGRVYSWKVARSVLASHPWVGVGPANLDTELAAAYRQEYPAIEAAAYLKPHNQLLYWLVSFGLLGTLVAVAAFYYPLLRQGRRPPPLLLAQYVILSLSFLVEPTLETPVGLPFAVLFVLLAGQRLE
ncbi:O-antigen ligase family protein [uncultured Hymenobacter sp.]|uniref:O-antigen ligase family protein n=1 Tax=uncultured Hymenobacter sp. TaxID=170016 RepID=UPI0035CA8315